MSEANESEDVVMAVMKRYHPGDAHRGQRSANSQATNIDKLVRTPNSDGVKSDIVGGSLSALYLHVAARCSHCDECLPRFAQILLRLALTTDHICRRQ